MTWWHVLVLNVLNPKIMIIQWQRKKYDFCDADSLARTNLGFFMWLAREIGQNFPIFFGQKLKIFGPGYIGIMGSPITFRR